MAKRKRLTPANPAYLPDTILPRLNGAPPPIAGQAAESAAAAALAEVSDTLAQARAEGRMVVTLPLSRIDLGYLMRDRLPVSNEDLESLVQSLKSRGQQTPVEVASLGDGRYGLISGWRRCQALGQLHGDQADVLALVRQPADASAAYVAMVEENEIRSGLSFYERARIVLRTVENGVYDTEKQALAALFGHVPRARRSKIKSFTRLVHRLDKVLHFPQAISEKMGLRMVKAMTEDPELAARLSARLVHPQPATPEEELNRIERVLQSGSSKNQSLNRTSETDKQPVFPGLSAVVSNGKLTLDGPALTPDLRDDLLTWLRQRHG